MTYKIPGSNVELSDEEVKELREVFDVVDKDKGGSIDSSEVKELMEMLGMHPTLDDVMVMIADIDKDGSGTVDFDEFLQCMAKPQQVPYTKADLVRAFRLFADRGAPPGCIAPETLEQALLTYCTDKHGLEDNEIMRLIHTQETSSDGKWINFADRINVFMNK